MGAIPSEIGGQLDATGLPFIEFLRANLPRSSPQEKEYVVKTHVIGDWRLRSLERLGHFFWQDTTFPIFQSPLRC